MALGTYYRPFLEVKSIKNTIIHLLKQVCVQDDEHARLTVINQRHVDNHGAWFWSGPIHNTDSRVKQKVTASGSKVCGRMLKSNARGSQDYLY